MYRNLARVCESQTIESRNQKLSLLKKKVTLSSFQHEALQRQHLRLQKEASKVIQAAVRSYLARREFVRQRAMSN